MMYQGVNVEGLEAYQQCRNNTGDENPVKSARATDRCIRRPEPGNIFHAQQVSTDQYPQSAADISERCALFRTEY